MTRPDRRRGRGTATSPSPVKQAAEALGLPVSRRSAERWPRPASNWAWWWPTAGSSRPAVLDAVPMVNLHFSLLPRWRGAAPVERAILAGDPIDRGLRDGGRGRTRHRPGLRPARSWPSSRTRPGDSLRRRLVTVGSRLLVDRAGRPACPSRCPRWGSRPTPTRSTRPSSSCTGTARPPSWPGWCGWAGPGRPSGAGGCGCSGRAGGARPRVGGSRGPGRRPGGDRPGRPPPAGCAAGGRGPMAAADWLRGCPTRAGGAAGRRR